MKDLIPNIEYALKDPFSFISISFMALIVLPNLDKITGFLLFIKPPFVPISNFPDDNTRSSIVLRDLEIIRWFKRYGMPYMERYTREIVFCLHDHLKGKVSYGEIALSVSHIHIDQKKYYFIKISSIEQVLYYFILAILIGLIILMGIMVSIISGDYLKTRSDYGYILFIFITVFYLFVVLARFNAPVHNAIKLKKLMRNKKFLFTEIK